MSPQLSHEALGQAVVQAVQHGTFPQSEDVASAPVPAEAFPKLLEEINNAQEGIKQEIRSLAPESASSIDGWISQAKKVQADIKRLQTTADEIARDAEAKESHTANIQDRVIKTSFLYSEMGYSKALSATMTRIQSIRRMVDEITQAASDNQTLNAIELLNKMEKRLDRLGKLEHTRVVRDLRSESGELRERLVGMVTSNFERYVSIDVAGKEVTFLGPEEEKTAILEGRMTLNLDESSAALIQLGNSDLMEKTAHEFYSVLLAPFLNQNQTGAYKDLTIGGNHIRLVSSKKALDVSMVLYRIREVVEFCRDSPYDLIRQRFLLHFIPPIVHPLIENWLTPQIPISLQEIDEFEKILDMVNNLIKLFEELGVWKHTKNPLRKWVRDVAQSISKARRNHAIAMATYINLTYVHQRRVERVETQTVAKDEVVLTAADEQEDNWGAEWGDDLDEQEDSKASVPEPIAEETEVEEEDMSAWGIDEDEEVGEASTQDSSNSELKATEETNEARSDVSQSADPKPEEDADPDAWGWGEDEEETQPALATDPRVEKAKQTSPQEHVSQSISLQKPAAEQTLTIRETYTVTSTPDALIELMKKLFEEAATLKSTKYSHTRVTESPKTQNEFFTSIMRNFRAMSVSEYIERPGGDMLLYNDCMRYLDSIKSWTTEQGITIPTLDLIESLGKRAYGREMESQRTILGDILDNAQGFQSCTKAPLKYGTDQAIDGLIHHIKTLKQQWEPILSHSVLLQSIGSLLSTALTRIITEIEDKSHISQPDCDRLHEYFAQISELSSLFVSKDADGEQREMVGIYVTGWFRFQYLGEILAGTLADIRYLWTEGGLAEEMDGEEVAELILALYEESSQRNMTIRTVRGGRAGASVDERW